MAILASDYWRLTVQEEKPGSGYIYNLEDTRRNRVFADMDYHYGIISGEDGGEFPEELLRGSIDPVMLAGMLQAPEVPRPVSREIEAAEDSLTITGRFSNGIRFTHSFSLDGGGFRLRERISLTNETSETLGGLSPDFGFRKLLFSPSGGWIGDTDLWTLQSLPTRRYCSQRTDRRLNLFTSADLLYAPFDDGDANLKPGFTAEAWIWGTEEGSILINTYNSSDIEFSRFRRFPLILPGRGQEETAVLFGGAARYRGDPEGLSTLEPGETRSFGETCYTFFAGAYEDGAYLYRSFLEGRGHGLPPGYNPRIHWNELYNLGWFAELADYYASGIEFRPYTREDLFKEADLAASAGAEALYLDPGWDTAPGSTIWDTDRLGSLEEFSRTIHDSYGLGLALHLMMTFWSSEEDKAFFWRDSSGRPIRDPEDALLFRFCPNEHWVKEKTTRLLSLAAAGVDFFMFDFTAFGLRGAGCCCPDHGHEVPMQKRTHAKNILQVIQNIKKAYPEVVIEAHDRIRGGLSDYHPVYFQHGGKNSFDEAWGYEYMWNPLQDLLSGKALSLYEYNLAYSLPLYLHINAGCDTPSMLQFWWYASTVRHLGFGGVAGPGDPKFIALQGALGLYKKLRSYLAGGEFYGIDPAAHLHVSGESGGMLLTLFNLTGREAVKTVNLDPGKYGVERSVKKASFFTGTGESIAGDCEAAGKGMTVRVKIPALSPVIVLFTP